MKIGQDEAFYGISIRWRGATAQLRRGDEFVADIDDVTALDSERRELPESEQVVLLLRFGLSDGRARVLFLDSDPVQSNAREVGGHLRALDEVFDWLLEPGYVVRQGDVGVYRAAALPSTSRPVAAEDYPKVFEPVLSRRHSLQPLAECELAAGAGLFHVRARGPVRLVHPEHHAVSLAPGLYELRAARGEPLPSFTGLRSGERAALGE